MLKNRKTDQLLFAVLFTLYLKDDVDEDGNVKDGVEGGKPLHLMPKEEKYRHEKELNGAGAGQEAKAGFKVPDTSQDDVD